MVKNQILLIALAVGVYCFLSIEALKACPSHGAQASNHNQKDSAIAAEGVAFTVAFRLGDQSYSLRATQAKGPGKFLGKHALKLEVFRLEAGKTLPISKGELKLSGFDARMVDHNHGMMIKKNQIFYDESSNSWDVNMELHMGGDWTLYFVIDSPQKNLSQTIVKNIMHQS